ncbi:nuclease-related domain-containing protein, partial [Cellulomonas hominis]|uniref:nuclease-related domain-containing protein n=1 Tax=Cellulomonas hominis TaxID=156981 RepID=UPI001BCA89CE
MDQGIGTGDPVARRARRRARWWGTAAGTAPGVPAARPAADRADDWFDSWLTDSAATAGTRRALERADGWTSLTDLHRPGSGSATVDLVAVGPGGIVVVETLHGDGEITVAGGTLRHRGYGRTPDVAAVAATAGALTALLAPTHRRAVHAVLCLAGRDHEPVAVCGGGTVVGERQLAAHLAALPVLLPTADVALVVEYLTAELGGPTSPEQLTVDDVFRPAAVWAEHVVGCLLYTSPNPRDATPTRM